MNKKINISIVGTGLMGLQHIKAIQRSKNTSLHSIVEIKKAGTELAKKIKVPLYKSTKILLDKSMLSSSLITGISNPIILCPINLSAFCYRSTPSVKVSP